MPPLLGGAAITWNSKKQKTVALSSTEAEYMALTKTSKEAIFTHLFFLNELGIIPERKIMILCNNVGANKLGRNPVILCVNQAY